MSLIKGDKDKVHAKQEKYNGPILKETTSGNSETKYYSVQPTAKPY